MTKKQNKTKQNKTKKKQKKKRKQQQQQQQQKNEKVILENCQSPERRNINSSCQRLATEGGLVDRGVDF